MHYQHEKQIIPMYYWNDILDQLKWRNNNHNITWEGQWRHNVIIQVWTLKFGAFEPSNRQNFVVNLKFYKNQLES